MTTTVTLLPNNYIILTDYVAVNVCNPTLTGNVTVIIKFS